MSARAPAPNSDSGWPSDALEVGRIIDAWGIKGWIKVQPFSSEPDALRKSRRWHLKPSDDLAVARRRPGAPPLPPALDVAQTRWHGEWLVARIDGIDDRNGAESLRGARVFVPRADFPAPQDPDEFYWVDLIGLDVVNRQGEAIGRVVGLLETGPQSVLRVAPPDAAVTPAAADPPAEPSSDERLIPFVAAYVDDVDVEARRITVDWGLDF
ncbi:ribosome maturation factor RimM [Piscinibacter koreensis]|uniref:Ribosome maturation factor RimM n=1 Tax=Piscinibacter koreensis TaxID=2742824 RepID=A0A7Y6NPT5_9BURK|nr:ribosome maturation factor RimM [Schlegelella koreensis]